MSKGLSIVFLRAFKATHIESNLEWWRRQQHVNELLFEQASVFKHPDRFGIPRRWEEQFPRNWMLIFSSEEDKLRQTA